MAAYFATPKTSTTSVGTTATKIPATAQASRMMIKIVNLDATQAIYLGDSGVTTSTGWPLGPGAESDWIPCSGDIYGIVASGTATAASFEGA
jgi:hypothetical protein